MGKDVKSSMISDVQHFEDVVNAMNEEGNGLLTAQAFTSIEATKLLLRCALGGLDQNSIEYCYLLECDNFLSHLGENQPLCSNANCDNPMHKFADVGCIVVLHGVSDHPHHFIAAGVCSSCFEKQFGEDVAKTLEGFLAYLHKCLPGMKVQDRAEALTEVDEAEFQMELKANAPTSAAIN